MSSRLILLCVVVGCGGSSSSHGDVDGGGSSGGSGTGDGGTLTAQDLFDDATATIAVDHPISLAYTRGSLVVGVAQQTAGGPTIVIESPAVGRTFSPTSYAAGTTSSALFVVDVDGDTAPDLLGGGFGKAGLDVLLAQPGGTTFVQSAVTSDTASSTENLAAAKFDAGDTVDLVVGPTNANDQAAAFVPGHGDGTFGTPVPIPTGFRVDNIHTGDFNNDGKADLVVASFLDDGVVPMLGNGDGTFAAQAPVSANNPGDVAVADVDGDGKADLVILTPGKINFAHGNGDGTFAPSVPYDAKTADLAIILADLDGDGKLDVIAQDGISDAIEILLGRGDGTFADRITVPFVNVFAMALGDVDGDGRADLALLPQATAQGITVMFGRR